MSIQDFDSLIKFAQGLGPFGLLLIAMVGFLRKWWVFGWTYDDKVKEAAETLTLLHNSQVNSESATRQAERVLALAEKLQDESERFQDRRPERR